MANSIESTTQWATRESLDNMNAVGINFFLAKRCGCVSVRVCVRLKSTKEAIFKLLYLANKISFPLVQPEALKTKGYFRGSPGRL